MVGLKGVPFEPVLLSVQLGMDRFLLDGVATDCFDIMSKMPEGRAARVSVLRRGRNLRPEMKTPTLNELHTQRRFSGSG